MYVFIYFVVCAVMSALLIFEMLITTIVHGAVKHTGPCKQYCGVHKM